MASFPNDRDDRHDCISRVLPWGLGHLELNDGATTTIVPFEGDVHGASRYRLLEFPTVAGVATFKVVGDGGSGVPGFAEIEAYLAS